MRYKSDKNRYKCTSWLLFLTVKLAGRVLKGIKGVRLAVRADDIRATGAGR